MTTFLVIILGLLPGFIWLAFYLREDTRPEPKKLLVLTFISGGAFVVVAIILEYLIGIGLAKIRISNLSPLAFLIFALVEEVSKFLAAYGVIHKNKDFKEPIEAMIYMIVASLGFATVENLVAVSNLSFGSPSQGALLASVFQLAALRLIGATLLHTLASGIVGYWWAMSIRRFFDWRYLAFGLALAAFIHMAFNILILNFGELFYPLIFLVIIGFLILADFEKLKKVDL